MVYNTIICAGTFDRLHIGHKAFIRRAFALSKNVYLTITSDTYTSVHKPMVASYSQRVDTLRKFLQREGLLKRAKILPIDDVYGITLDDKFSLEAILITEDSQKGAEMIQTARNKLSLRPLVIEIMPMVVGEAGIPLSSTYIREDLFDHEGKLIIKEQLMKYPAFLPDALRQTLQKPFGKLIQPEEFSKNHDERKIIAIGDVTTKVLHQQGFHQALSIIDFFVERRKQNTSLSALGFVGDETTYKSINPHATITPSLWTGCGDAFSQIQKEKKVILIVDGEEDLAVFPALLLAPDGFTICYGQPGIGMVVIPVNRKTKEQALTLLLQFQRDTRGY